MKLSTSKPSVRSQIYAEQVAHLYKLGPLAYLFSIFNGFLLAYLQRSFISNQVLLTWFSILLFVTAGRALMVNLYHRTAPSGRSIANWHWAYLVGTAFAGVVWGSAAIFLFPEHDLGHQLFVVFVLAGMSAGAVPVLAASMMVFYVFALPTLIPLAFQIFWHPTALSNPMAMMILFYLLGLSVAVQGMNRTILTSLMLRFDNNQLIKEIAERQIAEDDLFQQKERLQITFSAMAEGVIITDAVGSIEYLNPAAENMSGWVYEQARGKEVGQVISHYDEVTEQTGQTAIYECLQNATRSKKTIVLLAQDSKQKIIEEVATPLRDRKGNTIGAVAIFRDITQASEHSRQLAYQASHDALTDLPNRSLLCDRLEHALAKAIRANHLVAVLFMDLNRFKQINDSLGHAAGDILLKVVAERLNTSVRQEDTVARLGGDEFVVVLEDLKYRDQAMAVALKIVEHLANPIMIEDQDISVSVSMGISVYPKDGDNVETLLKNADTAMYRTKELAQENIKFYTDAMSLQARNRLKIEHQLQQAVAREELELYYQPRVDMVSGEIIGLEALVRWRTAPDTLVLPADFIDIAEETGSIITIGEWVLRKACRQAQFWHKNGFTNLCIAVNISVRQIRNAHFAELVANVLTETGMNPGLLELEITESLFLKDAEHAVKVLQELKTQGVKLAIDDFGTGYSSLTYIKQFPIDILKIDRSFIHDITEKSAGGAIVSAIITMGHGLDLEVIAEGVEHEVQRRLFKCFRLPQFSGLLF